MRRAVKYIFLLLAISLAACEKDKGPCFSSAGDVITETRPVSSIRIVELHDNVDLVITHDTTGHSLRVEAAENLIEWIKTDVKDEKLTITNENRCNWLRDFDIPFRVYLNLPRLDTLIYRSSGDLECTNTLVNDSLQVDIWEGAGTVSLDIMMDKSRFYIHEGTADLYVKGTSVISFLSSRASGEADLSSLTTWFTYMQTSSPNDCFVYAKQHLSVTIDNIGNVYYKGEAQVYSQINSSGKLIKLD